MRGMITLSVLLAALSGCMGRTEPDRLMVYCGAGIRLPVAEIAERFGRQHGVTVECDYAGGEVLLARIKLSSQGDVYLPGDQSYVDQAAQEGLIAEQQVVAYFVPVILVQKGNPQGIRGLADLTKPGIKVGLGDAKACAIGRIATAIFRNSGIPEEKVQTVFRSLTVDELANNVRLGALDAAIVWDAVAARTEGLTEIVPIPPEQNVISTVPAAVLACSSRPDLARKLVAFMAGPEGRRVFQKHHYAVKRPSEAR